MAKKKEEAMAEEVVNEETTAKEAEVQPQPTRHPVEKWRELLGTPSWLFAAAKVMFKWPVGRELTEEEYRQAIRAAEQEVIR